MGLLDMPRGYVVLSQQLGARNRPETLFQGNTLLEAKKFLAKYVKERRGIVHTNGRAGRYSEEGATIKVTIKRRRIDASVSSGTTRRVLTKPSTSRGRVAEGKARRRLSRATRRAKD